MNFKKLLAGIIGDALAPIAGALLTLSFAPFGIYPLAIVAILLFMCSLLYATPKRSFWRGFMFGAALFGTGVYWVYISIHTFGEAPIWLSAILTGGLVAILSLFPALNGYLLNRFFPKNNYSKLLLAFPAYWMILEWTRSWIFTGFPWLTLGYSQMDSFLRGYAPIFSVYGVSLMVLITASIFLYCIKLYRHQQIKYLIQSLIFVIIVWVIGGLLTIPVWTDPLGKPVSVSMVQGNIPQSIKWSPESVQPTLSRYHSLTNNHWDSKIIIWPEGAIPLPLPEASDYINALDHEATQHGVTLITGIPIMATVNSFYNAIVTVGVTKSVYLKQRLVPFGEYTPFKFLLKDILGKLKLPMSDFIPGPGKSQPLVAGGLKISAFICYEIAFPEQVIGRNSDSSILLTVSDDAWFGHSIAQAQHLQMAQMRALELAKPLLFVSNDGLTAAVTSRGAIQAIAPPFTPYVLTADIQPRYGKTPWQLFGLDPVLLIITVMLIAAVKFRKR
jgi:apolipoprotein N-acyltransferase